MRVATRDLTWRGLPKRAVHVVADYYLARRHSWLGWSMLTLRMKYLNGAAEIGEAERAQITGHLAETLPASGLQAAMEYLAGSTILGLPLRSGA